MKYNPDETKKVLHKKVHVKKHEPHKGDKKSKSKDKEEEKDEDRTLKGVKSEAIEDKRDNYEKRPLSKIVRTSTGFMKRH